MKSCITITFGDQVENHVGMQKIGNKAKNGFLVKRLKIINEKLLKLGYNTNIIELKAPKNIKAKKACILIIKNFCKEDKDLLTEQINLNYDTKAKMYGRIVNKKARYNLCFCDFSQEPNYEEGKGRVICFDSVPLLKKIRENLGELFGSKAKVLNAEGNYYYDISKCGIGFHGDGERKIVIGLRLGNSIPLHYQWFYQNKPIGERINIELNSGDLYIMSRKAVGNDWKKKNIATLRHAAGCDKFLNI